MMADTIEIRRQWEKIFNVLKEKTHQLRMLYPVTMSFKNKRIEIKAFFRSITPETIYCHLLPHTSTM